MAQFETSLFGVTVSVSDGPAAVARVADLLEHHNLRGFVATGRWTERSARHGLWTAEVQRLGGDVNDAWVVLTSYGASPDARLGSSWQGTVVDGEGL